MEQHNHKIHDILELTAELEETGKQLKSQKELLDNHNLQQVSTIADLEDELLTIQAACKENDNRHQAHIVNILRRLEKLEASSCC